MVSVVDLRAIGAVAAGQQDAVDQEAVAGQNDRVLLCVFSVGVVNDVGVGMEDAWVAVVVQQGEALADGCRVPVEALDALTPALPPTTHRPYWASIAAKTRGNGIHG
jgi:hypothetical protein